MLAQNNDTIQKNTQSLSKKSEGLEFILRPTLGLGTGVFSFYGDITNNYKGFHHGVSRIGYDIRITNPLTDYLDLSFYTIFGTVSANERSATRNLNMWSQIRTGGVVLSYNFNHILPKKRKVEPYIYSGIESFEFLTKTDLYDKYGNFYYYWSDGSIRNIAEEAPNAYQAVEIFRDYVYETDVRESNLDGFGKYPERSWAIPVGIGINMHLNQRWKFRLGTSYHIAFTDRVDGITKESINARQGKKGTDKFVFTSFSINYDLQRLNNKKQINEFELEPDDNQILAFIDTLDWDGDGVVNIKDSCAKTPSGVAVDAKGCPLDTDGDFVPDYRDDEVYTPKGNYVDTRGVTISEEEYLKRLACLHDTTGMCVIYESVYNEISVVGKDGNKQILSANLPKKDSRYVVIIGNEAKNVTASELHKYLGYKDFRTIESGDTIYYVVGNYKTLEEAIARKNELTKEGIKPTIVAVTNTQTNPVTGKKDPNSTQIQIIPDNKLPDNQEQTNTPNDIILYRVQIGAFNKKLSSTVFRDVPDLVITTGQDGIVRYYSGSFNTPAEAARHKINLQAKGYQDAFVVAYKDSKRIPLEKAGFEYVDKNEKDDIDESKDLDRFKIDKSQIHFRIMVGAFKNDVPATILNMYLKLGDIKPAYDETGITKYYHGNFNNYIDAEQAKQKAIQTGLKDAYIIGDFNGKIISVQEALNLLNR
jgi:hypothetical protein